MSHWYDDDNYDNNDLFCEEEDEKDIYFIQYLNTFVKKIYFCFFF